MGAKGALSQYSDFPDFTCNYGVKSRSSLWRVCLVYTQTHFLWTPVKPRRLKHVCKTSRQWPTCSFAERMAHWPAGWASKPFSWTISRPGREPQPVAVLLYCPNSLTQSLFKPQPLLLSDNDACKTCSFIHSLIQHLLTELPVCGRNGARSWKYSLESDRISALRQVPLHWESSHEASALNIIEVNHNGHVLAHVLYCCRGRVAVVQQMAKESHAHS